MSDYYLSKNLLHQMTVKFFRSTTTHPSLDWSWFVMWWMVKMTNWHWKLFSAMFSHTSSCHLSNSDRDHTTVSSNHQCNLMRISLEFIISSSSRSYTLPVFGVRIRKQQFFWILWIFSWKTTIIILLEFFEKHYNCMNVN